MSATREPRPRWKIQERHPIDASGILAPVKSPEWWVELASRQQERFWSKVEKRGGNSCWLWKAGLDKDGYGKHAINAPRENGRHVQKHVRAHRCAWEMAHGPIPCGMVVCHSCDTPGCVRPTHMFLGTQADNRADCVAKGRGAAGEKNGNASLSEEQVREIKILAHHARLRVPAISRRAGVPKHIVWSIARGKTWRRVTPDVRLYRPNLAALHAERKPGCCVACDAPLPTSRPALCGDPECDEVYERAVGLDYRARKRLAAEVKQATAPVVQASLFGEGA